MGIPSRSYSHGDMCMADKAIECVHHPTPTIGDLIHTKWCCRADPSQLVQETEFWHKFTKQKSFKRSSKTKYMIHDIPGSQNISNGVVAFGRTQAEHDDVLRAIFHKFSEVNVTLNRQNCEVNKSSITFFGFVFQGRAFPQIQPRLRLSRMPSRQQLSVECIVSH